MSLEDQKSNQRGLAKRFYEEVGVEECRPGFKILLDGRPIKTPQKHILKAPTQKLAKALMAEWDGQKKMIDPSVMPLTKMLNTAIDRIPAQRDGVIDELVSYAGSDMVCYRACEPESLVARQNEQWNPLLDWLGEEFGITLTQGEGVIHIAQSKEDLEKIRQYLASKSEFFLSGFHSLTTLSGSFTVAMACAHDRITPQEAWAAAHLDADWQAQRWGTDEEAQSARANAYIEFKAADLLLKNV